MAKKNVKIRYIFFLYFLTFSNEYWKNVRWFKMLEGCRPRFWPKILIFGSDWNSIYTKCRIRLLIGHFSKNLDPTRIPASTTLLEGKIRVVEPVGFTRIRPPRIKPELDTTFKKKNLDPDPTLKKTLILPKYENSHKRQFNWYF